MKMKYFVFFLGIITSMIAACKIEDENPTLLNQYFFECYDETLFGPLDPASYYGLPDACIGKVFDDQFDNNDNDWYRRNDSDFEFLIRNNVYSLTCKTNTNFYISGPRINYGLDNFQIETVIRVISGDEEVSGITWGGLDGIDNINFFGINTAGTFSIGSRKDDQNVPLLATNVFTATINPNDFNILTVRKFDGIHYFFINYVLVYTSSTITTFGQEFGLRSGAFLGSEVDRVLISNILSN